MAPGFSPLSTVRKEVRGIGVCAPAHIVDGSVGDAAHLELKSSQRGEIPVGSGIPALHYTAPVRRALHLARNLFADLEGASAYMGTNGDDQLGRIVEQCGDSFGHDPGHGAAPTGVHCGNVSARGVRDQNRYTIGSAGGHSEPFDSGNKRVAFRVGDRFCNVGSDDFPHVGSMHLPLLEQAIAGELETPCKARSVLANRVGVVAQVEPEVERIEGRRADATVPRRKRMAEPMPIQKGGVQSTHTVVCSMSRSRDPPLPNAPQRSPPCRAPLLDYFPTGPVER